MFRVQCGGVGVEILRIRLMSFGFRVSGFMFQVSGVGSGFRGRKTAWIVASTCIAGPGIRDSEVGFRVRIKGFGFKVEANLPGLSHRELPAGARIKPETDFPVRFLFCRVSGFRFRVEGSGWGAELHFPSPIPGRGSFWNRFGYMIGYMIGNMIGYIFGYIATLGRDWSQR